MMSFTVGAWLLKIHKASYSPYSFNTVYLKHKEAAICFSWVVTAISIMMYLV